jgi:hypothetical protein
MKHLVLPLGCLLAACSLLSPVQAGFLTRNDLSDWCSSSTGNRECAAYVLGVADAMTSFPDFSYFCLPLQTRSGQLRDVVANYLQIKPEERQYSAASLVAQSLHAAFPCKALDGPSSSFRAPK